MRSTLAVSLMGLMTATAKMPTPELVASDGYSLGHLFTEFSLYKGNLNFDSAAEACHEMGSSLATITSAEDTSVLKHLVMMSSDIEIQPTLGVRGIQESAGVSLKRVSYVDGTNEDLDLVASGLGNFHWQLNRASSNGGFICRKETKAVPGRTSSVWYPNGDFRTGLVAYTEPASFAEAVAKCEARGDSLARISSDLDAWALSLFSDIPSLNGIAWIGVQREAIASNQDPKLTERFYYTDGNTETLDFIHGAWSEFPWGTNEPNGWNEQCVAVSLRPGANLMHDFQCQLRHPAYVCRTDVPI